MELFWTDDQVCVGVETFLILTKHRFFIKLFIDILSLFIDIWTLFFIILLQKIKLYIYENLADRSTTQTRKHPETHQWIVIHSLGNAVISIRSSFAYEKAERNLRLKWNLTKAA